MLPHLGYLLLISDIGRVRVACEMRNIKNAKRFFAVDDPTPSFHITIKGVLSHASNTTKPRSQPPWSQLLPYRHNTFLPRPRREKYIRFHDPFQTHRFLAVRRHDEAFQMKPLMSMSPFQAPEYFPLVCDIGALHSHHALLLCLNIVRNCFRYCSFINLNLICLI